MVKSKTLLRVQLRGTNTWKDKKCFDNPRRKIEKMHLVTLMKIFNFYRVKIEILINKIWYKTKNHLK